MNNMDTNLILTVVQIIAVAIVPLIVWVLGVSGKAETPKLRRSENYFLR